VIVVDASLGKTTEDEAFVAELEKRKLPYILVYNKSDMTESRVALGENELLVSARTGDGINALKEKIGEIAKSKGEKKLILADLINQGDMVVLCIPIDEAAPKGRLILPQQLVLRELLDCRASALCCQPGELSELLSNLQKKPRLVITDSQVFGEVSQLVPQDVQLTSFSILMARYKGELSALVEGAGVLSRINDGDKILISEGCTHHRQCNDIGTVKLPGWIKNYSKAEPDFSFTSGGEFPKDLSGFSLVVHCGGCMLNEKEMKHRMQVAEEQGVPMVNYGVAIAQMNGILSRSLEPFQEK
jgi:[FeFe] hydrogenase H-cluster maturation GTPase HydF